MKKIPNEDLKSHIERVRDLKIRDDDVYLATYPKSGTHWVWEIIVMLRRGSAEYEPSPKEAVFLDFKGPDVIDKVPSPRVLNCHWPCNLTPRGIFDKNIKIVHVQRNPKDIIVSFYYHHKNLGGRPFTESFLEFLPLTLGTYGIFQFYPWYKYVKEWERFTKTHPEQILNLYFEDMKEDPVREIKKIDKFLGTGRSDELIQQIAQACHFDNLKKADLEIKEKEHMTQGRKPSIMFRKGEVGDWKNHFTVAQNAEIDEWLQENLAETELKFRYTI
ncbi:sulfotransferase 1A1-like isoform X2 [Mercenaria mercenaria]|nr:sulfotransferase 1A1-like isoform X2 [Mercenaria mercenaria]